MCFDVVDVVVGFDCVVLLEYFVGFLIEGEDVVVEGCGEEYVVV